MSSPSSDMTQLISKLDELSRLRESEHEINKTISVLQYFDKMYTLCYGTANYQKLIDTLIQKNYPKLCHPIFHRIYKDVFKSQECWHITYYLLHSFWNYTDKAMAMCSSITDAQFLPMLMYNISQENYLKHFSSNEAIRKLFDMIISILHNMAQVPELVPELRQNQCLENLNRIIQAIGTYSTFLKGISYLTLAYIIREDERVYLINSNESIPYLVNLLHEAMNTTDHRSNGLEARELCKGLSKLSVADNNKFKIYSESKLLDSLINMLEQHKNCSEQISACTLIWNLAFDPNVKKVYRDDEKLNKVLTMIAQTSSNDELRRVASGCLCTLMGGPSSSTTAASKPSPLIETDTKKIMISYNHDIQQKIKQIKEHLVADGYNVWIDTENMHGNLFDAMANAIENSTIFLLCLTERYKDSPSCRLECEYAYQRKKHIIPLVFQANYKPDGWLGLVLGAKYYINYAKKSFENAYSETLAELQALKEQIEKKPAISPPNKPAPSVESSRPAPAATGDALTRTASPPTQTGALVHLMSQFRMDKASEPMPMSMKTLEKLSITDTQHFLAENGLEKFMPMFIDMDGIKLIKLFEIKNKALQFYYMLIKDKWDQMNQAKERSQDLASSTRSTITSTSLANYLQLITALDKIADRVTTN